MKKVLLYLAAYLVTLAAFAQSEKKAEQEVLAIHESIAEAYVQEDTEAIEAAYADDFVFIGSDGKKWTKEEMLAIVKDGTLQHDDIQYEDMQVRTFGNTAVVTGIWHAKGAWQDESTQNDFDDRNAYTFVYVKQQGQWKVVSAQFSLIEQT